MSDSNGALERRLEPPCTVCNGFYAQRSSVSSLCRVCHSFLYPLGYCKMNIHSARVAQNKSDSEDSGTEELQDPNDVLRPPPTKKISKSRISKDISDELNEVILALSGAGLNDVLPDGKADGLPEDVLLIIFSYLDDVSLWSASQVCSRWKAILDRQLGETLWKKFTLARWPFMPAKTSPDSWQKLYTKMIHSSSCFICLSQQKKRLSYSKAHYNFHQKVMPVRPSNVSNRSDFSLICRDSRITHEMSLLTVDPLEGAFLKPIDSVVYGEWYACILGPSNSPYEGGHFYLSVSVPCRYPMDPPVVRFLTKIFHPNVSQHGDIGLDSLQHNWSLALTLPKVLLSIQSLLTDPYTKVCMEPEVGEMYQKNYALYEHTARMWTLLYAKNHVHNGA